MLLPQSLSHGGRLVTLLDKLEGTLAIRDHEVRLFFPDEDASGAAKTYLLNVSRLRTEGWDEQLRERSPRVLITGWGVPMITPELTTLAGGSVDYICHVGGAVRQLVTRDMIVGGLRVSNWGLIVAPLVAEHAILLVLATLRNLPLWSGFMRQAPNLPGKDTLRTRSLRGKRVGIYGFGAITRELVSQLKPFQVEISAFSAGVPPEHFAAQEVAQMRSLEELCRRSDVLVCCEALTLATRGSLNAEMFRALPEEAVFVNIARGAIVNETALIEVASERGLRVGLDVFESEPLNLDSPLHTLPGAVLSPHIAGPTHDYYRVCGEYAIANLERYASGLPPESLITPEIFDRAT